MLGRFLGRRGGQFRLQLLYDMLVAVNAEVALGLDALGKVVPGQCLNEPVPARMRERCLLYTSRCV